MTLSKSTLFNIIAPLGLWSTLAVIFKNSTALLF
jgi:hypothetical protein